ncbi:DMT family transporter [Shimia marina]|uniref:Carboxylate/amino acid/amine transporter n=1 Tax=Shimia marina TaxID=321267 RepID=A0A0P1ES90_9RHOB|nr:DMT family transporter [Shimia marina]CUH53384.1 carboxylate/amino acid/amine transporter [Shimia marina]SFD78252.1 EamA domain-containing membrane protein RarD [Shimia marina]
MNATLKAAFWMSGAILSFTAMAVAGRAVSFELDTFEIMMYRSIVGILVVCAAAHMTGSLHQVTRRHLGLHFVRNLSHFAGQNLWFYALTAIPLAQVFALEFTSPIWAILLTPLILGERLRKIGLLGAMIGFIGILIVARPNPQALDIGQLSAATAAIGFALSALFTRKLTRSESITCILFYLTVMQAGFGVIFAGFDGDIALPSAVSAPWILLIACAGLVAHFCLTTALRLAPASVVMPIDFIRLPLIAVVGMTLYGEMIDIWVLLGAGIIFAGNYLNILAQLRLDRAQN